eukprot:366229-Chlamydomonas_euryale.AAC.13
MAARHCDTFSALKPRPLRPARIPGHSLARAPRSPAPTVAVLSSCRADALPAVPSSAITLVAIWNQHSIEQHSTGVHDVADGQRFLACATMCVLVTNLPSRSHAVLNTSRTLPAALLIMLACGHASFAPPLEEPKLTAAAPKAGDVLGAPQSHQAQAKIQAPMPLASSCSSEQLLEQLH